MSDDVSKRLFTPPTPDHEYARLSVIVNSMFPRFVSILCDEGEFTQRPFVLLLAGVHDRSTYMSTSNDKKLNVDHLRAMMERFQAEVPPYEIDSLTDPNLKPFRYLLQKYEEEKAAPNTVGKAKAVEKALENLEMFVQHLAKGNKS